MCIHCPVYSEGPLLIASAYSLQSLACFSQIYHTCLFWLVRQLKRKNRQPGPKAVIRHPNWETFQIPKLGPLKHVFSQKEVLTLENLTMKFYEAAIYNAET